MCAVNGYRKELTITTYSLTTSTKSGLKSENSILVRYACVVTLHDYTTDTNDDMDNHDCLPHRAHQHEHLSCAWSRSSCVSGIVIHCTCTAWLKSELCPSFIPSTCAHNCANLETITDTPVVEHDLATQWIQAYPVQNKNFTRNTKEPRKSSWSPTGILKSLKLTIPWNSAKLCEDLSWNHCTSTPHRSETNGIAERAGAQSKGRHLCCIVAIRSK